MYTHNTPKRKEIICDVVKLQWKNEPRNVFTSFVRQKINKVSSSKYKSSFFFSFLSSRTHPICICIWKAVYPICGFYLRHSLRRSRVNIFHLVALARILFSYFGHFFRCCCFSSLGFYLRCCHKLRYFPPFFSSLQYIFWLVFCCWCH